MFGFFKKEPPKAIYLVAYACDDKHCQAHNNGGICQDCGELVKEAVCKGMCMFSGARLPYAEGFVRWMDADHDGETPQIRRESDG